MGTLAVRPGLSLIFAKVKETIARKGGMRREQDIIKAASSARSLIPIKYGSVDFRG